MSRTLWHPAVRGCGLALGLALVGCGVDPLHGGDGGAVDDTGAPSLGLGALEGTVLDGEGRPVVGAQVTTDPRGYIAETGTEGRFAIALLPPDRYEVVAAADGFGTGRSSKVEVLADFRSQVEVTLGAALPAGGRLHVRVTGPDGLPLGGAAVAVGGEEAGRTDADGVAVLDGIAGEDLDLAVSAEGLWPRTLAGVDLPEAGGLQWEVQLSGRPPADAEPVGSGPCGACHPDQGRAHDDTRHARAHGSAPGEALLALFAEGARLELDNGGRVTLALDGDGPLVELEDAGGARLLARVAGYLGDPDQATVPWVRLGEQGYPLPLGYVAADPARGDYPDAQARLVPYQVQRWYTATGAFDLVAGAPDPATSAERSCLPCHVSGFTASLRDDGGMDLAATDGEGAWDEDGVSCERCHGAGGDHMMGGDAERPFLITQPGLLDRDVAGDVCGQCHARTATADLGLPWPWTEADGAFEPGLALDGFTASAAEHWPTDAAALSRMQVDELRRAPHGGPATGEMGCIDCHAPHGEGVGLDGGAAPASLRLDARDNSLCLSCHLDMDFGGELDLAFEHTSHLVYDPEGPGENARCTGCHMPGTATEMGWSERSGAGDHASHLFSYVPPQATLDAFDAAGLDTMEVGTFPVHGCADCHAYNAWRWEPTSLDFIGPTGDPRLRATHQDFQDAAVELWP